MITRTRIKEIIREAVENTMMSFITNDTKAQNALLKMIKEPNFFQKLCINDHGDPESEGLNYYTIASWINQNLSFGSEYLESTDGAGASRFVFRIGDEEEFVIKIAYDFNLGVLTNRKEIEEFISYGNQLTIFPRIYLSDKESFEWFVVEMVEVPEGEQDSELKLGEVIKNDYPIAFSNIRDFMKKNLPPNINSDEHIDILLNEVPKNSWFGMSGGIPSVELFYFLSYLHEYQENSDIFTTALMRSDLYLIFSQYGTIEEYKSITKSIIETFSKDRDLKSLAESFNTLGVEINDLGVGNLGISKIDGSLKVIDISIFDDPTFTPNFLV